jgi:hypothetical protein
MRLLSVVLAAAAAFASRKFFCPPFPSPNTRRSQIAQNSYLLSPYPTPAPITYNTGAKRVEGKVNVHIVAHSHDDVGALCALLMLPSPVSARYLTCVFFRHTQHENKTAGWLKTVDQYYYGANNSIQHANVNSILSATVLSLLEDPNRKFSEVEQAFFQRWWAEQTPAKQAAVKGLVASGALEFINGGWSMHDEACPTFVDMLDNTALGQRLIYESFGVVPKTTWQIDPCAYNRPFLSLCAAAARALATSCRPSCPRVIVRSRPLWLSGVYALVPHFGR